MDAPDIHIEHLQLDLRGVPPDVARQAVAALGPALAQALADPHETDTATPIRLAGADAGTLRDALAQRVAAAIAQQMNPPTD